MDNAPDVKAFAKLPRPFGFAIEYTDGEMNLRSYYPDFVAKYADETCWLLETQGQETADVPHKDHAARLWAENATTLIGATWKYLKVTQKEFEVLQPESLQDLVAISLHPLFGSLTHGC